MDTTWAGEDDRELTDHIALGVIIVAVIGCGLLTLGGFVAPFVVSSAYDEYNLPVSIAAGVIGALLALYLLMTWVSADRMRTAVALVLMLAGLGFYSVHKGIPATFGALQGNEQRVVFEIAETTRGGRRSCAGVYIRHPGYSYTRICGVHAQRGMRLELIGRVSWFGIVYTRTRVID